jgi:hypothetical protein
LVVEALADIESLSPTLQQGDFLFLLKLIQLPLAVEGLLLLKVRLVLMVLIQFFLQLLPQVEEGVEIVIQTQQEEMEVLVVEVVALTQPPVM